MTHTLNHDTGIFRSETGDDAQTCDVCGEPTGGTVINVESVVQMIQICPECAILAGEIGQEVYGNP